MADHGHDEDREAEARVTDLEKNLVPFEEWDSCGAPLEAVKIAREETHLGVPTGIALDPKQGWVVLQSSGQGPYLIWQERKAFLCEPCSVSEIGEGHFGGCDCLGCWCTEPQCVSERAHRIKIPKETR